MRSGAAGRGLSNRRGKRSISLSTRRSKNTWRGFQPQSVEAAYAAKAHFRQLEAEFEEYAALDFGVQARKDVELAKKLQSALKRSLSGRTTLRRNISISSSISTLIGR